MDSDQVLVISDVSLWDSHKFIQFYRVLLSFNRFEKELREP